MLPWDALYENNKYHLASSIDEEDIIASWIISGPFQKDVVEVRQLVTGFLFDGIL